MEKFTVDVKLNEDDIVEFQKAHYSKLVKPVMRYSLIGIIAVLFIINVILDVQSGYYYSLTGALLGIILIVLLSIPLAFRLSAKKSLRTNKMLMATQTYTFTENTVSSFSENHTISTKWSDMYDFRESRNHFLFYISNKQAFLIPKRLLMSDDQKLSFIRKCAENIPKPQKTLNLFKITMAVSMGIVVLLFIIMIILN